jgi:hypothetical protein
VNTDRWYYRVFQGAPDLIRALLPGSPGFRKVVTPLVLFTRGLEDMTNASLQRGRQG